MESSRRVSGRLLLIVNLAAASGAAALLVVGFARPGMVGLDTFGLDPAAVSALAEAAPGRAVLISLHTGWAWLLFLLALALLVCNFAWLVRRAPAPAPRNYVLSDTPTGSVRVAREALEAGLRGAGEQLPEITRLRVNVDCGQPKRILVLCHFNCAEGTSNLNASQRLRQTLRDRFREMVQLMDGCRCEFELEFQGFLGKLARKSAEVQATLEPEPPPFTGPQYPIDDEDK